MIAPRRLPALLALFLAAAWGGAGCGGEVTSSVEVGSLTPIQPRAEWREIYLSMEECTGKDGAFDRVDWFRTDRIADLEGEPSGGAWLIAEGRPHGIALLDDLLAGRTGGSVRFVVRHEVIHEILQLGDHSDPVWCECDARPELFPQCDPATG